MESSHQQSSRPQSSKNRWLYVAGAAVACAGVLVAANVAFAGAGPGTAQVAVGAPAAPSKTAPPAVDAPTAPPAVDAAPTVTDTASSSPEVSTPLGRVFETGLPAKSGKWVLYLVAIDEKQLPKTHFGVMLGRRLANGTLTADVETNATSGSELAKGFHAGEASMNVDGRNTLTFGYYVGPAAKITAKAHGKTITAGLAVSDKYPSVRVWWFAPSVSGITGLAAYDEAGRKLATGNGSIGVG